MPSRIEGMERLSEKLRRFGDEVASGVEAEIDEAVRQLQKDAAANVPVDTGRGRAAIASPEAVDKRRTGNRVVWRFGFLTRAMQAAAFYLYWVEFGTKGYSKGESRSAGVDKKGRRRTRKIKRDVPARPAQPWFRPALLTFKARMSREGLGFARITAGARRAAGFARQ